MSTTDIWILVVVMAAVSFPPRAIFILFAPTLELPSLLRRALRFVPAAVFPAIIAPSVLVSDGMIDLAPTNPKLLAVLVAGLIAMRNANPFLVVLVGMVTLHIAQAAI